METITSVDQFNQGLQHKFCVFKVASQQCGPCKVYSPKFEKLAGQYEGIHFMALNHTDGIFKVSALPTTLIVVDGIIKNVLLGGDIQKLEAEIDKNIPNSTKE